MKDTVINFNVEDAAIENMKEKSAGLKVTNNIERKDVAEHIKQVKDFRVNVEKRRVALKADALAFGKKVDVEAKRITGLLLEVETPLKNMRDEYDAEKERIRAEKVRIEEERISKIREALDGMKNTPITWVGCTSVEIKIALEIVGNAVIEESFFREFFEEAKEVKSSVTVKLNEMFDAANSQEAEAKRLAEERKKFEEQQAAAEIKRKKAEAIEQEKIAEQRRELEKERAANEERFAKAEKESAKKMAEQQAKIDEENAEIGRKQAALRKAEVVPQKIEPEALKEALSKPTYEALTRALEKFGACRNFSAVKLLWNEEVADLTIRARAK